MVIRWTKFGDKKVGVSQDNMSTFFAYPTEDAEKCSMIFVIHGRFGKLTLPKGDVENKAFLLLDDWRLGKEQKMRDSGNIVPIA